MEKRRLGHTGIEVSPIGLGVMQFSGGRGMFRWMMPNLSQEEMNGIVRAALDSGINWFDTAEMYGRGRSERGLANALKAASKRDDEVVVATKWSPILRTAGNIPRSIEERLHHLGGYTIDLYMVHQPWGFSPPEAEMEAMADLVEAGKIRSVGVSNFNAEQMRRAHEALAKRGLPLAVNQVRYSLLHRAIETNGVLEAAKELGVTIVAWGPLASGLLTGKFHKNSEALGERPFGRRMRLRRKLERSRPLVDALEELAAEYDATPAQVALSWLINAHGETVVAIPGASKAHHAEESAGAMRLRLSDLDAAKLDVLGRAFRS
jgi:aryl-alcohol dehydrogenase-like predicted oxidoreductase